MAHNTGTVINTRYRIVKPLGQGGFGAVYRAWDLSLNKPCALKENFNLTHEGQAQFHREAMILAKLAHANLPRVTDHFSLPGQGQYLVMDFIDGEDLENRTQRLGAVPEKQAIEWINQVADTLTYLHKQPSPVIHRDIKPANIRLAPDGRVVLVDFGLVKIYDAKLQTTVGARAVTPGYSPPEQYGRGKTDARSDIYALAATLYKLLTGQEPEESLERLVSDTMPLAHDVNPQVSREIGQVIQHAMNLDPAQRYQTADEFKRALNGTALNAGGVVSPPGSTLTTGASFSTPSQSIKTNKLNTDRNLKPRYWLMGIALVLTVGMMGISILQQQNAIAERDATATIQAEKTATANAQQTATAKAEQTATAQAEQTATAQAEQTATAQAEQTATAEAEQTATAQAEQARMTATAQAEQAPPTATATARPKSTPTTVFGPERGSLIEKDDDRIESKSASVDLRDFAVGATFFNPYSTSTGSWDYGFRFRHVENGELLLVIRSDKKWVLMNRSGNEFDIIDEGEIENLDVSANGSNLVVVAALNGEGGLRINQKEITRLDLSARTNSGDVLIATGIYKNNEIDGKATKYEYFTIYQPSD